HDRMALMVASAKGQPPWRKKVMRVGLDQFMPGNSGAAAPTLSWGATGCSIGLVRPMGMVMCLQ
ncbi:MAG: hypothetical protein ACJAX5_003671, partial [Patiriisocius sp.]